MSRATKRKRETKRSAVGEEALSLVRGVYKIKQNHVNIFRIGYLDGQISYEEPIGLPAHGFVIISKGGKYIFIDTANPDETSVYRFGSKKALNTFLRKYYGIEVTEE